ncbi:MAG: AAA family ATPase [Deltaproteobacteria bacterium]|nr:AAA family ATPase [Deltaproteobacteria bacterium]
MLCLEIDNFRALRRVRCAFDVGMTLVVAPNGAGKTTLLSTPELLRHMAKRGLVEALDHHGGRVCRTWDVVDEDVRLRVRTGALDWELRFSNEGEQLTGLREQLWVDGNDKAFATQGIGDTILRIGDEAASVLGGGPAAFSAAEFKLPEHAADFHRFWNIRSYTDFDLYALRVHGSPYSADTFLHPTGRNVFSVLRNWRDKSVHRQRYQLVVDGLRSAFPRFRDFEFESAGQVVVGGFVTDAGFQAEPLRTQANGVLAAMLHLVAVGSVPDGGYVGLDEPENALHPFAIRAVLEAIEDYAQKHAISVVASTHSPVVLDHFQPRPERVLAAAPDSDRGFVPLTELEDELYLNDFALGRMYAQGDYAAPPVSAPNPSA